MTKPVKIPKILSNGFQDCKDTLFCDESNRSVEALTRGKSFYNGLLYIYSNHADGLILASDASELTKTFMTTDNIEELSREKMLTM
jgi:hypothetical protein